MRTGIDIDIDIVIVRGGSGGGVDQSEKAGGGVGRGIGGGCRQHAFAGNENEESGWTKQEGAPSAMNASMLACLCWVC